MIEPPRGTLETPIGTVSFTMTEAGHVYLCSEGSKGQAVTIRGIPYHVAYHCHLIDGKWGAKDWHDPYLNRSDCYKDASQAARNTAREVLATAWTEFAWFTGLTRSTRTAKHTAGLRKCAIRRTRMIQGARPLPAPSTGSRTA